MDLSNLDSSYGVEPKEAYARLFAASGALWSSAHQSILVGDPSLVRSVLLDTRGFTVASPFRASRRVIGASMLDLEGEQHVSLRRTLLKLISAREVAGRWSERILAIVDAAVHELAKGDVNRSETFIYKIPLAIAADVSGLAITPHDEGFSGLRAIIAVIDGDGQALHDALEARASLEAQTQARLEEPDDAAEDTLIAVLRRQLANDEISLGLAKSFVTLFLASATETTACAFATLLWALARHPELEAALHGGALDAEAFVVDVLRRWPPLQFTARFSKTAQALKDTDVGQGAVVSLCLGAAQLHADSGPCSDAGLVFGVGTHSCPGRFLATAELVVFIRALASAGLRVRAENTPKAPTGRTFHRPGDFAFHLERAR